MDSSRIQNVGTDLQLGMKWGGYHTKISNCSVGFGGLGRFENRI